MSLDRLLENWNDYDNKKIIGRPDSNNFACTENGK